ncbi:MAG: iron dependent repressor, metal binding and dimerization domain protein [Chitinophagaceae bacterium]
MQSKYTIAEENYIKAIFHLQEEGGLSTGKLSAALKTRPASATDMLKKLKEKKLISWSPYKKFRLTMKGKKLALNIVRRHRLWEYFLSEKLHFEWDEVHAVAEELEHVSSEKLINKLDAYLNFPRVDPHGDPIPDAMGNMQPREQLRVADLPVNTPANIIAVAGQELQLLELLKHFDIGLGTRVEVKKRFDFDESMEVKIKNKAAIHLGEALTKTLIVKII